MQVCSCICVKCMPRHYSSFLCTECKLPPKYLDYVPINVNASCDSQATSLLPQWRNNFACSTYCALKNKNKSLLRLLCLQKDIWMSITLFLTCQVARGGSIQCGHLEQSQRFIHVCICGERCQPHLCLGLGNTDDGFQLPGEKKNDGRPDNNKEADGHLHSAWCDKRFTLKCTQVKSIWKTYHKHNKRPEPTMVTLPRHGSKYKVHNSKTGTSSSTMYLVFPSITYLTVMGMLIRLPVSRSYSPALFLIST